jgi:hypothetical protein
MKREKKKERAGRWGCDVKLTPNMVGVKEGLIDRRTNLRGGQTGGCAFQPPQADDYRKWKVMLDSVTLESRAKILNLPSLFAGGVLLTRVS